MHILRDAARVGVVVDELLVEAVQQVRGSNRRAEDPSRTVHLVVQPVEHAVLEHDGEVQDPESFHMI